MSAAEVASSVKMPHLGHSLLEFCTVDWSPGVDQDGDLA